jgi:Glycosyltransferase Family 4
MSDSLRVALIDYECGKATEALAAGLLERGHRPAVLTASSRARPSAEVTVVSLRELPDAPLRLRKIGDRLAHVPDAWLALSRGQFDVAHAFTATDALPAIAWSRRTGRPSVFTCVDPPRREDLAARRLRLATWQRAVEGSDAVIAPNEDVARALRRWLAVDASVLAARDGEAHLALYDRLTAPASDG